MTFPNQSPKDLISKIMSLVDDAKDKLQENDYLDMCNFLKTIYNLDNKDDDSDNEDDDSDDEDSDNEDDDSDDEDSDYDPYQLYRITLNEHLHDVCTEKYEMINNLMEYVLHNKILICEDEGDDIDNHYDEINHIILDATLELYDLDTVKKLIERLGGEQECLKLFKHYNNNPLFREKVMKKQFDREVEYYRCIAFYGMHKRTFDWEYVERGIGNRPSIFIQNLLCHLI